MDQSDVNNMSAWLQQILKMVQNTNTELAAMKNENKALMDQIKATAERTDQKDSNIMSLVDSLKSQIDVLRGEVSSTKSAAEGLRGHMDSKVSDLKSEIHEVRNRVA